VNRYYIFSQIFLAEKFLFLFFSALFTIRFQFVLLYSHVCVIFFSKGKNFLLNLLLFLVIFIFYFFGKLMSFDNLETKARDPQTPGTRFSPEEISTVVRAVLQSINAPGEIPRSLSQEMEHAVISPEIKLPLQALVSGAESQSFINFKAPPGLPEFKQGECEPERFFVALEQLLTDVQIQPQFWRLALLAATQKDKAANNFVRLEMANVAWATLKDKFVERFKLQPLALHVRLHAMRQRDESVDSFFNRFSEVAQQLFHRESTPHIMAAFVQALQPSLRQPTLIGLRAKLLTQPMELSVALVAAKEAEAQLPLVERPRYNATRYHKQNFNRQSFNRFKRQNYAPVLEKQEGEHKRSRLEEPEKNNSNQRAPSLGRPFRRFRSHRGRGRGSRGQVFSTDRVEVILPSEKEIATSSKEISLVEKPVQREGLEDDARREIPRHPVPAEINSKRIIFKYDIGAERSIVSKSWCERNNIKWQATSAQAQSFHALSSPTPLIGEFIAKIRVQGLELEHKFFVEHLFVDGLFGEDLAVKTSMIPLLPLTFPSQQNRELEDADEQRGRRLTGEEFDIKEELWVKNQLQEELARNALIPQTSFCNLEFAAVSVQLIDEEPVYRAQYPIPGHLEEPFAKVISDWLARRRIEPSNSRFNSPVTVVHKKSSDGLPAVRVCLDFRQLNAKLKSTRWAAPVITDVLGALSGKNYYAEFDLKEAYLQLPVKKEDRYKLAFTTKIAGTTQRFQFRGAPFGLWHLPGHFQEMMSRLLADLPFVAIYLDNIVVASNSLEEHSQHCLTVIQRLSDAQLRLNVDKVKVARKVAAILGHLIDAKGIGPDPARIQALKEYPIPQSAKELERYIGALVFIRPFLPRAHELLQYLHSIKSNKKTFEMRDKEKYLKSLAEIREGLNHVITTRPFIAGRKLGIATDASRVGIAAVLFYVSEQHPTPHPDNIISMVARGLLSYERSYPIYQLELLAIVFAATKFHHYIFGSTSSIEVLTDHSALVELMAKEPVKQTVARWLFQLNQYKLVFKHIKGNTNTLPDLLSRATFPPPSVMQVSVVRFSDELKFFLQDRQLVPEENRKRLLDEVHAEGHVGRDQLMKKLVLQRQVYWPNMAADAARRIRQCAACMKHNVTRWGYHPRRTMSADRPMQKLQIDIMELPNCQGYVAVLVIICVFSGFLFLRPLKNKTAEACATAFLEVVWLFGPPLEIVSDNASDFINKLWSALLDLLGVRQEIIPPYYPLPKGRVERAIGAIRILLRKYLEGDTDWVSKLGLVQFRLNSVISAATKSTPFALMFARAPTFPPLEGKGDDIEAWENIQVELTNIVQPALADVSKTHRQVKLLKRFSKPSLKPLVPGTQVMMRDHHRTDKMDQVATGPYTVIMPLKHEQYLIKDASGTEKAFVVPRSHLRPSELKEGTEYEVEAILDSTSKGTTKQYLVKWTGFDEPTWINSENFLDEGLIRAYEARNTDTHLPAKAQRLQSRRSTRSRRK